MKVYYGKAVYDKKEINASLRVLKNKSLTLIDGPSVKNIEFKISKLFGKKFGLMVNSGSSANLLALSSFNFKKGSEIITPSLTFSTTVSPIYQIGCIPHFIDVEKNSFISKIDQIKKCINKKTVAIMIPNLLGNVPDWKKIYKIAKKYKLKVIEDSAEALGLKYKNKECGSFGDVSTFSFYANKHITTGEGGMIVTNNKQIAEKCKSLRNLYFNNKRRFVHYDLGWNYRFTNLQAAIGLAQLEKLNHFIIKKRSIGKIYNKELSKIKIFNIPLNKKKYAQNIYWVYGLVLKKNSPISLNDFMKSLKKHGIETRNFFWPLHQQPILKKMGFFKNVKLPVAEYLSKNGFYLPTGLAITSRQQKYVIDKIKKIIFKYL